MSYIGRDQSTGSVLGVNVLAGGARDPNHGTKSEMKTARWVVKIGDGITTSTVDGNVDCCELFQWYERQSHYCEPDQANQMVFDSVRSSHVELFIPNDDYVTLIEAAMYKGNPVTPIIIKKINNMAGADNTVVQTIQFDDCFIQYIEQHNNDVVIGFRFGKRTNTVNAPAQNNAASPGNKVSTFDFINHKSA